MKRGDEMTLITCNCNCIHQHDGYCRLETPSAVTNSNTKKGCVHFVKPDKAKKKYKNLLNDKTLL